MAIRMKEWGMLQGPAPAARIPMQGMNDVTQSTLQLGASMGDLMAGTLDFVKQREERAEITQTGELAAFSERLDNIGHEVSDELAQQDVADWGYAWNLAASPRLNQAIEELSPHSRAAARKMAQAYSQSASLEAQRKRELDRVETARSQWAQRVEAAVESGDEASAAQWLQVGRGVFVPEQELEQRQISLQNRSRNVHWKRHFERDPMQALIAWNSENASPRPADKQSCAELDDLAAQVQSGLRAGLADYLVEEIRAGRAFDAPRLEQAAEAGLVSSVEKEGLLSTQTPAASQFELAQWNRRIDECGDDEDLRLELASSSFSRQDKVKLLERIEAGSAIPVTQRQCLSRELWGLYSNGKLGNPADEMAQKRMLRLQNESFELMCNQGSEELAQWLLVHKKLGQNWLCFQA